MRGLLYGVAPEPQPEPDDDNHLLRGLAQTPMRLVDLPDPEFLLPDWVVTRPRLTGVCGSDAKQVFMDWVNAATPDNPMKGFFRSRRCSGTKSSPTSSRSGPKPKGSTSAIGSCSTRGCRAGRALCRSGLPRARPATSACAGASASARIVRHPHGHVE